MKKIIFLMVVYAGFSGAFIFGMENQHIPLDRQNLQYDIDNLLKFQYLVAKHNIKKWSLLSNLDSVIKAFQDNPDTRKNTFSVLRKNVQLTLLNLFIEELMYPSVVLIPIPIVGSAPIIKPHTQENLLISPEERVESQKEYLRSFYKKMAPAFAAVLHPKYDFSEIVKFCLPSTYDIVTGKNSIHVNECLKEGDSVDKILANSYLEKLEKK